MQIKLSTIFLVLMFAFFVPVENYDIEILSRTGIENSQTGCVDSLFVVKFTNVDDYETLETKRSVTVNCGVNVDSVLSSEYENWINNFK